MKKRLLFNSVATVMLCSTIAITACKGEVDQEVKIDENKTQLYVGTRGSGLGSDWLDAIGRAFEEKYANVSFEEGKTGVQVITSTDAALSGSSLASTFALSEQNVVLTDAVPATTMMAEDLFMDITDVVKGTMDFMVTDIDGKQVQMGENATIESKLYASQIPTLGKNGNYELLPWTFSYAGITYNADIWIQKLLYFAEDKRDAYYMTEKTISSYTGKAYTGRGFIQHEGQTKSVGPDGQAGTYDDGMPSSYEEFMYLLDFMSGEAGVDPMVVTGVNNYEYGTKLYNALLVAYNGKEDMEVNYTSQTQGDNTVKIVTGWNGSTPVITEEKIDFSNGYLMSQQAAKYYALDLLQKIYSNDDYWSIRTGTPSHTETQSYFINSTVRSGETPIGMIVEGSYWYNEAKDALKRAADSYGYENPNFKTFPIPRQLTGTVEAGEGTPWAIADELSTYAFVNANIQSKDIQKLAKLFVRFAYTDEMLQMYSKMSSLPVMVKYDVEKGSDAYAAITSYGQDQIDIYHKIVETDSLVWPVSTSKTYKNQSSYYMTIHNSEFWQSGAHPNVYRSFSTGGVSAKDYFVDSYISVSDWNNNYNK